VKNMETIYRQDKPEYRIKELKQAYECFEKAAQMMKEKKLYTLVRR